LNSPWTYGVAHDVDLEVCHGAQRGPHSRRFGNMSVSILTRILGTDLVVSRGVVAFTAGMMSGSWSSFDVDG
jgi:hypothetical protein